MTEESSDYPFGSDLLRRLRETGIVNVPVGRVNIGVSYDEFVTLNADLLLTRAQFREIFSELHNEEPS